MSERLFGHVPGYPEGSLFENRAELNASRVHIPTQAGISGSQTEGAESIVLSGGYEDDTDCAEPVLNVLQVHTQKLLTYARLGLRTAARTQRTIFFACVRIITCSSITVPSRLQTIYL
jgi:predicted restriction endonuclease